MWGRDLTKREFYKLWEHNCPVVAHPLSDSYEIFRAYRRCYVLFFLSEALRRYLSSSEGDFEVFRPAGTTRCRNGGEIRMKEWTEVKFGKEEWTGPLLHAKFHPHWCNDKGIGPPKNKIKFY